MKIPELTVGPIQHEIVTRFSLAQRDFNPIHISAAAAHAAGFSGPIVHGMYVLGQFELMIRSWQSINILSLQGRFLRPVSVGTVVVLSGRVVQLVDDVVILRLLAKNEGDSLVAVGEAKVRMTPS